MDLGFSYNSRVTLQYLLFNSMMNDYFALKLWVGVEESCTVVSRNSITKPCTVWKFITADRELCFLR